MTPTDRLLPVNEAIDRLEAQIRESRQRGEFTDPLIVGIHTGGVWVADALHRALGCTEPLGRLNITFYRDDFHTLGLHPQVSPSDLSVDVDGRDIILVDDVLFTGRTVRAAMNELFDYGRPRCIALAVLYQRDGRELPICADWAGQEVALGPDEQIHVDGPEPITARLVSSKES
ncbi:bifunctional pyr operon transcriptional regulator/uracil phosphoribosyltransferase PyrR [Guyparkeria hydrothermalis]|uniref:bifunctional pyr operon transcriptional regulator/uracil phosphoribosyltransferase PyrR n=1 Tax=Guyparkeria hydrothermalis TaxID=923 RepID=UPI002020980F|nr:bifunctional pyr operon transcriptional regulator/uracil phosphoribosyltransferase PyrR [Guyparkeria hydrothermalis]MCL7743777.1 bifunctional pyr operon transcriptional regulator/uracil phosphoribosyltransferase PyrR [Guyparkeria hydrothermalis]